MSKTADRVLGVQYAQHGRDLVGCRFLREASPLYLVPVSSKRESSYQMDSS